MFIYKLRPDGVLDCAVEVPDGTTIIPSGHTFSTPPEIPAGHHAVMLGGWRIVEGEKPPYPPIPQPTPVLEAPIPQPTFDSVELSLTHSVQKRLDSFAQTRKYTDILSACSYVNSSVQEFQIEGQYCVQVRDQTWIKLNEIIEEIRNEIRPLSITYSDIESELPVLVWPSIPE